MHIESGAPPCVGVPSPLGEQTRRYHQLGGSGPRANESAERARLGDVARLSVEKQTRSQRLGVERFGEYHY